MAAEECQGLAVDLRALKCLRFGNACLIGTNEQVWVLCSVIIGWFKAATLQRSRVLGQAIAWVDINHSDEHRRAAASAQGNSGNMGQGSGCAWAVNHDGIRTSTALLSRHCCSSRRRQRGARRTCSLLRLDRHHRLVARRVLQLARRQEAGSRHGARHVQGEVLQQPGLRGLEGCGQGTRAMPRLMLIRHELRKLARVPCMVCTAAVTPGLCTVLVYPMAGASG